MDQPLTSNDHLNSAENFRDDEGNGVERAGKQSLRGGVKRARRRTTHPETDDDSYEASYQNQSPDRDRSSRTSGDDENPLDDVTKIITVKELQSRDLSKLLMDGMIVTGVYMIVGAAWFMATSRWTFTNTIYFMVMSLLTVGYGDITVRRRSIDRVLDSLLILLGLVALGTWAAYAAQAIAEMTLKKEKEQNVDETPSFSPQAKIRRQRRRVVRSVVWMIVILAIGNVVFMFGENASFTTSFYWAVVTSSTIGYGDVVPTTDGMKWFTIFYAILATVWMVQTLRLLGGFPFKTWRWQAEGKVFNQFLVSGDSGGHEQLSALTETAVMEKMGVPPEREGSVSRAEFCLSMLMLLDRIKVQDYEEVARIFDGLGTVPEDARPEDRRSFRSAMVAGDNVP